MRQRCFFYATALALPLALVAGSWAAEDQSDRAQTGSVLKDEQAASGTVRLSKLIGTEAKDAKSDTVGKIKDVVFDAAHDQVDYIVLGQPKALGAEKLVALPFKAIKFGSPNEKMVYTVVNREVLEKAPGFKDSQWPMQANADYYRSLDTYYNTHLADLVPEQQAAAALPPGEAQKAAAQTPGDQPLEWHRRATNLEDREVITPAGQDLGKISDVVLDRSTGKVDYVAFKDIYGKLHAVPLSSFKADLRDKKMVLDTTRDQLKQTPSFDEDRWPSEADPRWPSAVGDRM